MKIYSSKGDILLDIEVDDSSYAYREIMGRNDLTLYFALTSFVDVPVGSNCVFQGVTYYLMKPEALTLRHTRNWEYVLTMETHSGIMPTAIYQNPDDRRLKFSVSGPAVTHLNMLVRCLNNKRGGWSCESNIDEAIEHSIGYDFCDCKSALQLIADTFDTEWEITGKKIILGKVEHGKETPVSMSYGKGNGFLPGVERKNHDDEIPLSRLFVQGGDRNIIYSDYKSKTLLMPKNVTVGYDGEKYNWETGYSSAKAKAFLTDSDGASVSLVGAEWECDGAIDCTDIYPKRVGEITEVITLDASANLYDFRDSTIPLDLDYAEHATQETMTVIFQTGALAGREFDVSFTKRSGGVVINRFSIVPATIDEMEMPSSTFSPSVGDKYIVFHCSLPESYVNDPATHTGAEWEMLRKAVAYLWDSCQPRFSISGRMDGIWSRSRWDSIGDKIIPGGYISFTDERFSPEAFSVRITAVTQYVNRPYSPEITLSNDPTRGGMASAIRSIKGDAVKAMNSVSGGMNYSKRRFRDVKETTEALRKSLESLDVDFDDSIKPITVQTMQAVVGDDSLQYWFTENLSSDKEVEPPIVWDSESKRMECGMSFILHRTAGVTEVRANGTDGSRWTVKETTIAMDESGGTLSSYAYYYLYILALPDGSASFALHRKAAQMNVGDGSFRFLVGILNSEYKGERSFAPMYGYTEISPGRMTVNRIVSNDGNTYFDLVNGVIGGNIRFLSGRGTSRKVSELESDISEVSTAASMAKAAAEGANAAVSKISDDGVFTTVEKRQLRETMQAISSIEGIIKPNLGTVVRLAKTGPEWKQVTATMAAATPALADFVGWYRSMIAGISNGETVTMLTFELGSDCEIVVEFCSDSESSYDYLVAAAMDETQSLSKANADTLADVSTRGKQGISNKVTKTYALSSGEHTLQILYVKDNTRDQGTDSGYYRILSESGGVILSGAGTFHAAHAEATSHGLDSLAAELASRAYSLSAYLSSTGKLWADGDTDVGTSFRNTVYSYLRSYLEKQNEILSEAPVSDYEFLRDVFMDGSTIIAGGLVLTNMVGVSDIGEGSVAAGLNGSDIGKDKAHGKLMLFAGSESSDEEDLNSAHTRLYEDGTLITDRVEAKGGVFEDIKIYGSLRNQFQLISDSLDKDYSDNVATLGGSLSISDYIMPCDLRQSGRVVRVVNWKWASASQEGAARISLSDTSCAFLEDGIRKKSIYLSRECISLLGYGDDNRFYGWIVLQRTDLMTTKAYGKCHKVLAEGVVNCSLSPSMGAMHTFDASKLEVTRLSKGTFKILLPSAWRLNDNGYVVLLTTLGRTDSDNVIVSSVKELKADYFVFDCQSVAENYIDDAKVMFSLSNHNSLYYVGEEVGDLDPREDVIGTTSAGSGKLVIFVTPNSASIKVDGNSVNVTDGSSTVELSYGSHTVEVSASGYKSQTLSVNVSDMTLSKSVVLSELSLVGISIVGLSSISDSGAYSIKYAPTDVLDKYKGVIWSVVSGADYAEINQSSGFVKVKEGAFSSQVTIRATSVYNAALFDEKMISVTYASSPDISFADIGKEGIIEVSSSDTFVSTRFQYANIEQLEVSVSGNLSDAEALLVDNDMYTEVRVSFGVNLSSSDKTGLITVSGTRTDGRGTYTNSFSIIQAAAKADDGLPDGYTAIEYVATRGTKGETIGETGYIDTGIVDSTDLTYFVDFAAYPSSISGLTKSTISFQMGSCGDRSTGSNVTQIFTVNFPAGSGNYGTSGYSEEVSGAWAGDRFGGNKTVLFGTLAQGERHTLEWNSVKGEVIVDGDDSVGEFFNAPSGAESTDCTCYLFAVNFAGEPVDRTSGEVPSTRSWLKLYRFTVKDYDGNVICDMRPCVHDGKAGLYDTIRGSFFSSANNIELVRSDTDLNQ